MRILDGYGEAWRARNAYGRSPSWPVWRDFVRVGGRVVGVASQLGANTARATSVNPNETTLSAANASGFLRNGRVAMGRAPPDCPCGRRRLGVCLRVRRQLGGDPPDSGSRAWRIAAPDLDHVFTAPVVVGATLYSYQVGSGLLYTINASSGTVERTSAMLDNIGLVYSNGVLYPSRPRRRSPRSTKMGAYDVATGNLLGRRTLEVCWGRPRSPAAECSRWMSSTRPAVRSTCWTPRPGRCCGRGS